MLNLKKNRVLMFLMLLYVIPIHTMDNANFPKDSFMVTFPSQEIIKKRMAAAWFHYHVKHESFYQAIAGRKCCVNDIFEVLVSTYEQSCPIKHTCYIEKDEYFSPFEERKYSIAQVIFDYEPKILEKLKEKSDREEAMKFEDKWVAMCGHITA